MTPSPTDPPAILVADDEDDLTELMQAAIELLMGVETVRVLTAKDGLQSVALAQQHQPWLAVLDIGMPERGGISAAFAIRQDCRPLVIVGVSGSPDSVRTARLSGAFDEVWPKPIDMTRLTPHLWRLVREARAAAERGG